MTTRSTPARCARYSGMARKAKARPRFSAPPCGWGRSPSPRAAPDCTSSHPRAEQLRYHACRIGRVGLARAGRGRKSDRQHRHSTAAAIGQILQQPDTPRHRANAAGRPARQRGSRARPHPKPWLQSLAQCPTGRRRTSPRVAYPCADILSSCQRYAAKADWGGARRRPTALSRSSPPPNTRVPSPSLEDTSLSGAGFPSSGLRSSNLGLMRRQGPEMIAGAGGAGRAQLDRQYAHSAWLLKGRIRPASFDLAHWHFAGWPKPSFGRRFNCGVHQESSLDDIQRL